MISQNYNGEPGKRGNKVEDQDLNSEVFNLTVIRGPRIAGFSRVSEEMEYNDIPSANFWSEFPTYSKKFPLQNLNRKQSSSGSDGTDL